MLSSKIIIVHCLPHRFRFYCPHIHLFDDNLTKYILKKDAIKSFEYNPVSMHGLITFNPNKIDHKQVLCRIIIGMSLKESYGEVRVHDHTHQISKNSLIMSLLAVAILKGVRYKSKHFSKTVYFGTLFTAVNSLSNHVIKESFSTSLYKVMTLHNPETNEEYHHVEISEGGIFSSLLSSITGRAKRKRGMSMKQIAFAKE
ncbi:MAG TPA: hypothetical protein QF753_17505 [Victivallales bacterium]|nr:hypothetical protein [Victivallales bacterium]